MATATTKKLTQAEIEEGIQATVMAIRESIMTYFKGTCVERVTSDCNVHIDKIANYLPRSEFQYQRRTLDVQDPTLVKLGNVPILTMTHAPDRLTLHTKVFNRSPVFKQVRKELERFMADYLIGVDVAHNDGVVRYGA